MTTIQSQIADYKDFIVQIRFYTAQGNIISSGTGFIVGNFLISNSHVFADPNGSRLPNSTTVKLKAKDHHIQIEYPYFMKTLILGSDADSYDYVVFINPFEKHGSVLNINDDSELMEGDKVLIMGYPFDTDYLTSHVGYVSALFTDGSSGVKKIQLDASTNHGNSGGPVINIETGNVVGIMTRKETGLSKDFDKLESILQANRDILMSRGEAIKVGGIGIMETLAKTQEQLKVVTQNIKRSSNVGIGWAFSTCALKSDIEKHSEIA